MENNIEPQHILSDRIKNIQTLKNEVCRPDRGIICAQEADFLVFITFQSPSQVVVV